MSRTGHEVVRVDREHLDVLVFDVPRLHEANVQMGMRCGLAFAENTKMFACEMFGVLVRLWRVGVVIDTQG